MSARKRYLGDGVYADVESDMIVLTTEDGLRVTNRIYMEPDVYEDLVRFVQSLSKPEDKDG